MGALGFMFSASFVVWLPWDNTGIQLLLPWLCWAAYVWCAEGKRGALVGVALLTAFAVVGGNPEILAIVGLTAAIWTISLLMSSAANLRLRQHRGRWLLRWESAWCWERSRYCLSWRLSG